MHAPRAEVGDRLDPVKEYYSVFSYAVSVPLLAILFSSRNQCKKGAKSPPVATQSHLSTYSLY